MGPTSRRRGILQRPAGEFPYSDLIALDGPHSLGEASLLPPIVLLHVGHRWYDPALGRFVQRNPVGLDAGGVDAMRQGGEYIEALVARARRVS